LILGSRSVYFQEPPNVSISYPAIIYKLDDVDTQSAGNKPYLRNKRYLITVIDKNPDSDIPDKIGDLPASSFSRRFVADNLNHTAYTLYF